MRPRLPVLTTLIAALALSATCVTMKVPAPIASEQSPRPAKLELTYWTEPRPVNYGCIGDDMPLPTVPSVDTVMEVVHQESGHVWRCPRVAPEEWPMISFLPQCESSSAWQNGTGSYTVRVLPNGRSDEPEVACSFRYDDAAIGRITVDMAAPLDADAEAMCRIRRSRPAPAAVRILPDAVDVSPFGELEFPTFALANETPSALHSAHRYGGFEGVVELMDREGWRRVVVLSPASSSYEETVPSGERRRSVVASRSSERKGPGVVAGTYRYSVTFVDRALPPDRQGSWIDDAFEAAVVFQWPPFE